MASKEKAQPFGYPEPSFISLIVNVECFRTAKFLDDGRLLLEFAVSNRPMFDADFIAGLRGEFGTVVTDRLVDDAAYKINREIAIRMLLKD